MRIDPKESALIVQVLRSFPGPFEIFLCGSRVHDHLRGGDIDLFILVLDKNQRELLRNARESILVELKDALGDQKIDLTIATKQDFAQNPVYVSMLRNAVHLDDVRI